MQHLTIMTTVGTLRGLAKGPGSTALNDLAAALGEETPRTLPVPNARLRSALVGLHASDWAEVHVVLDRDPSAADLERRKRAKRLGHDRSTTGLALLKEWKEKAALFETIRVVARDREFKFVA